MHEHLVEPALRGSRILIVDDCSANIQMLDRILRLARFESIGAADDPLAALALFREFEPDIICLDLHMPHLTGFELMDLIRSEVPPEEFLPILMLTGDPTPDSRQQALARGATDFLTKPYDGTEAVLRIRNLLHTRLLHQQLRQYNANLELQVRDRTRDLELARLEVLERLARAAEYRDDETGLHTQRVGRMAARLAAALGLDANAVDLIGRAAPLHDVGKVGIPDRVLLKRGRLTREEFEVMQQHTLIGGRILAEGRSPLVKAAEQIALTHHENWDGTGYPKGLAGATIPQAGRIVAVVDVFDALTHARPYKPAWPVEQALVEMERQAGKKFDPTALAEFVRLIREIEALSAGRPAEAGVNGTA